jgi:DNA end-binding protein Ku
MRSIWKGTISIGILQVPIALSTLQKENTANIFHFVCPHDSGTIQYKRVCSKCGKEIPYQELKKGYFDGEKTIALSQEQIKAIQDENNSDIEIIGVKQISDLNSIYIRKSYWIMPQTIKKGKTRTINQKSLYLYELLRETLSIKGKCLIGKMTMRNRERLIAIMPYRNHLVLQQLYYATEIVEPESIEKTAIKDKDKKNMGVFLDKLKDTDISGIKDDYEERLMKLLENPSSIKVKAIKKMEEPAEISEMLEKAIATTT